jgi:hypothetical protein
LIFQSAGVWILRAIDWRVLMVPLAVESPESKQVFWEQKLRLTVLLELEPPPIKLQLCRWIYPLPLKVLPGLKELPALRALRASVLALLALVVKKNGTTKSQHLCWTQPRIQLWLSRPLSASSR